MLKKKNKLKCYVLSNKMNKTLIVYIIKFKKHKIYKKYIKKRIKMHVHDENNICNIGDYIEIKKCKPYSKKKSWIFCRIIKRF